MSVHTDEPRRARKRRLQNFFQIGDAAVECGMPEERRGAYAALEPDDGGDLNDMFAEIHSGMYSKRCADADLPWMQPPSSWIPSIDSQKIYIELAAQGLRWLLANGGHDFTTLTQEIVDRMGWDMVRRGVNPGRVGKIQQWCLKGAQWCVWTGRRAALRVDFVPFRARRGDYVIQGHKPTVVVKAKRQRVHFIDEATEARIISLIPDIAKRLGIRFAFLGCRGAEAAGVQNAHVKVGRGENIAAVLGKGAVWRDVRLDGDTSAEIALYRQAVRPQRLVQFRKCNRGKPDPTALLLNAKNGRALTYTVLRRAFKAAAGLLGLDSLRLHWARHAFAANFMAANALLMLRKAAAAGMRLTEAALKHILEQLRPELAELMGHANSETTKIYLKRVRAAVLAHLAAYPEPPAETRAA